jgi:hypothetical protein
MKAVILQRIPDGIRCFFIKKEERILEGIQYIKIFCMKKQTKKNLNLRKRETLLGNASQVAKIAYHNPVISRAFWDSYQQSWEMRMGMSFWNFMVKRFAYC